MPKCQLLFSAVFGFRNPSNEIFSESDEIKTQVPIFPGTIQNTREPPEGSPGGPTPHPGAARGGALGPQTIGRRGPGLGRAALWCRRLFGPLTLPFRQFKASIEKTLIQRTTIRKTFQSRRHREAKIWGTGVSVLAPCRRGDSPAGGLYTAMVASGVMSE